MNATTCPMTPDFDTLQAYLVDQVWSGAGGDSARQAVAGPVLQACQVLERWALRRQGLSHNDEGEIAADTALMVLNGPGREDGLGNYDPGKPLKKFVATIVWRRAIDLGRTAKRQRKMRKKVANSLERPRPRLDPHDNWAILESLFGKYIRMQPDPNSARSLVAGFMLDYLKEFRALPQYTEIAVACQMRPGYARCLRTDILKAIERMAQSLPPDF